MHSESPISPATGRKPSAEADVDKALVQALLREQHPDLADLRLVEVAEGWDNKLFRLGEDLTVRLPRRAVAAPLVEHEQRWLPELARGLPLPIPVPLRIGRPGCGYPWRWSITTWYGGLTPLARPVADPARIARALGAFVRALHRPALDDAPRNSWRGVPLAARTNALRDHLQQVGALADVAAMERLWQQAMSARHWPGPRLWIHGDLHPGNLIVEHDELAAVIDFGDLTAGDPATDLAIAWMLFPPAVRPAFFAAARGPFDPIDGDTLVRARGWAVALGLAYVAHADGDPAFRAMGLRAIAAALAGTGDAQT